MSNSTPARVTMGSWVVVIVDAVDTLKNQDILSAYPQII